MQEVGTFWMEAVAKFQSSEPGEELKPGRYTDPSVRRSSLGTRRSPLLSGSCWRSLRPVLVFRGQAGIWICLSLRCSALGFYSFLVLLERQGRPGLTREAGPGPERLC